MPTGVALTDVRRQLFDATERVLLRTGPNSLTSRAVTAEAGCAKGVLHRHFDDFDAFLAALVRDRVARLADQAGALRAAAGTGTVAGNLTRALTALFEPVAVAVVALTTARDGLRARLRETTPAGVPLLAEAADGIAAYLDAERRLGRLAPDADPGTLAATLVGAVHLHYADRQGPAPEQGAVLATVTAVLAGAARDASPS